MPILFQKHMPYCLTIGEASARLLFKRMTVEEFAVFGAEFKAYNDRRRSDQPESDDAASALAWLRGVFAQFISVVPGEITVDGEDVLTGAALFELVGNYLSLIPDILAQLYLYQCMTEAEKKAWPSRPASETGSSTAPVTATPGETLAPAAAPAGSAASVPDAAATPLSATLSGTTDPLSSVPVLSAASQ